jgi:hypothetical protein
VLLEYQIRFKKFKFLGYRFVALILEEVAVLYPRCHAFANEGSAHDQPAFHFQHCLEPVQAIHS